MKLSEIDTKAKREFLSKIQSGKFILKSETKKEDPKSFERLDNGLYRCKESGEELSSEEIKELAGEYDISIVLIDTRDQAKGIDPPDGYIFSNINHSDGSILDTLLLPK